MSPTTAMFIAGAIWVTIGLVTALFMGRRGHNAWNWAVLGTAFGPLLSPAAASLRSAAPRTYLRVLGAPARGPGPVDVLVGIDGSALAGSLRALPVLLSSFSTDESDDSRS